MPGCLRGSCCETEILSSRSVADRWPLLRALLTARAIDEQLGENIRVGSARRLRWRVWIALGALLVGLLLVALVEGDIPEALTDIAGAVRARVTDLGPAASLVVLYLEESGLPSPLPGDIFVLYLGQAGAGHPSTLFL
jgi:hypothetical protein